MNITIGNLKLFHDLDEIYEYLSNLPLQYLYQYQGQIVSINGIPILRVLLQHDLNGNTYLSYSRIRVENQQLKCVKS